MSSPLKRFGLLTVAALTVFTSGCTPIESADAEEGSEDTATAAEALTTFTIASWPASFPIHAGAAPTAASIQTSSGSYITFNVQLGTVNGVADVVTISSFSYAGYAPTTPKQIFAASPPASGSVLKNFTQTVGITYNIAVTITWNLPNVTIEIYATTVPGGSIAPASTTLCTDA